MTTRPGSADVVGRARERLRVLRAPDTASGRLWALLVIVGLTALLEGLNAAFGAVAFPPLALVVPAVLGGLLLPPAPLLVVLVLDFAAMISEALGVGTNTVHPGAYVVLGVVSAISFTLARDRERLGLSVGRGEQMLLDLQDQLRRQGELPRLPASWHAEVLLQSAGGVSFGGDFLVSTLVSGGNGVELALVDVSGKGIDAGTRALLLSGALGGLLGAVPGSEFLPAANAYLLRLAWAEGFATALHLSLDLRTGGYRLTNAGHLPGVHYHGGTGRWSLVEPMGTVLGLVEDADFDHVDGVLAPHDALLLYTDGLVEEPGRDLSVGLDRLLGAVERLIPQGFSGGARRVLDDVAPDGNDDRALVLLWRD